ncbi:SgcJ/EcaC family oxidoreductase [Pedobacter frigiditerrae]|uniref:SgcJ/EcaC family oxidoreductase n=1 Tax=Pedobacter frigiditerrae TaxID=2530452 RepID=A0A4R0MR73_9SPHI|nr:SgcJ/EcaC family oxidoreductase [Pedobacter frigiditerrae]TCC88534.1 SgcJ/EcaC family oxidoreductase [Pedobacter frigiditerrae]
MKKSITGLMTFLTVLFFATTINAQSKDQASVKTVVQNYFDALNASDVNKVVSYFTAEGVLLAPGAPTATGTEQLKGTFKYVFDNFTYTLAFAIADLTVEGDYAFVASTSKGSFVIKSSNQKNEDDFRETFILKRVNGQWKIARYMYNKSK